MRASVFVCLCDSYTFGTLNTITVSMLLCMYGDACIHVNCDVIYSFSFIFICGDSLECLLYPFTAPFCQIFRLKSA